MYKKSNMNFCDATKSILCDSMKIISTKLCEDEKQYNTFVKETKKVTDILKKKVDDDRKKMWDINVALKLLYHKSNGSLVDNKILYSSIGESLLSNIFTEATWQKRHEHYIKILKKNKLDIDLFKSEIDTFNITNKSRLEYFYKLSSDRKLLVSRLTNERCFFQKIK
jgi:hypothetical protein